MSLGTRRQGVSWYRHGGSLSRALTTLLCLLSQPLRVRHSTLKGKGRHSTLKLIETGSRTIGRTVVIALWCWRWRPSSYHCPKDEFCGTSPSVSLVQVRPWSSLLLWDGTGRRADDLVRVCSMNHLRLNHVMHSTTSRTILVILVFMQQLLFLVYSGVSCWSNSCPCLSAWSVLSQEKALITLWLVDLHLPKQAQWHALRLKMLRPARHNDHSR